MALRTMLYARCPLYHAPQRVSSALHSWLVSQAPQASLHKSWPGKSHLGVYATRHLTSDAAKKSDPLRILFCGSDEFSCASFKALLVEQRANPSLIRSIDVVVKPGKRTGRGLKEITKPPLHHLADSLSIRVHERDTFTGWDMPRGINLIIAVSFGLFVPPRLLQRAKYGGLNVHPSLLPDLRGPAPLQHTILQARRFTGVSLQTLDHKAFDHGLILSQTGPEAIPVPNNCTYQMLHDILAPKGAELLCDGLREALYVPPLQDVSRKDRQSLQHVPETIQHAPKITKDQQQINRANAHIMARVHNAIGPVWFFGHARHRNNPLSRKRVIVNELDTDLSLAFPPGRGSGAGIAPGRAQKQLSQSDWERDFEPMTLTMVGKLPASAAAASATDPPTTTDEDETRALSAAAAAESGDASSEAPSESSPLLEKGWEHVHLKAWVRKRPGVGSSSGSEDSNHYRHWSAHRLAPRDMDYVYLPDQGCRLRTVTVSGGKQQLARQALMKSRYLTEGHDVFE